MRVIDVMPFLEMDTSTQRALRAPSTGLLDVYNVILKKLLKEKLK